MSAPEPLGMLATSEMPAVAHLAQRARKFADDADAYRRLRDATTDPLSAEQWDVLRRVAEQTGRILGDEARALAAVPR